MGFCRFSLAVVWILTFRGTASTYSGSLIVPNSYGCSNFMYSFMTSCPANCCMTLTKDTGFYCGMILDSPIFRCRSKRFVTIRHRRSCGQQSSYGRYVVFNSGRNRQSKYLLYVYPDFNVYFVNLQSSYTFSRILGLLMLASSQYLSTPPSSFQLAAGFMYRVLLTALLSTEPSISIR